MKHEYKYAALAASLALASSAASAQSPSRTDGAPSSAATSSVATASTNLKLDVFDYRASDLIGAPVLDERGEHVAEVDDVVVSTEDNKLHAVLAVGGFLGLGEKLTTLPFDDLQITTDGESPQVRIAMTGARLEELVESRPEFSYDRQTSQTK